MYRKWLAYLGIAAVALAVVMIAAAPASAQRFGGWGWGNRALGLGTNYGYGSPWYGGNYYGGNWYDSGWGARTYDPGLGYSSYYPGSNWAYSPGYNYPNYGYGFRNTWTSYPATVSTYAPSYSLGMQYATSAPMPAHQSFYPADHMIDQSNVPAKAALFHVHVPPDAKISFSGHETQQRGNHRAFVTPALEENQTYSYDIRAQWTEDGRNMDRTTKVLVRAGDRTRIDLNRDMTVVEEMTPSPSLLRSQSAYEETSDQETQQEDEIVPAPTDRQDLKREEYRLEERRIEQKKTDAPTPNNNDDLNRPAPNPPSTPK